jgi:hypothetical protein
MDYNLFIDDICHPCNAFPSTKDTKYLQLKWIVVRSFKESVEVIEKSELPSLVSFDHDLAFEHYDTLGETDSLDEYYLSDDREMTGYECAKWLCDYCYDNKIKFPQYLVHSFNQVGYIRNFLKHNPELV